MTASTNQTSSKRRLLLASDRSFFDYGCGRGDDIRALRSVGFEAEGWDPAHRPDVTPRSADVVNLGYVVNVIDDPVERVTTLRIRRDDERSIVMIKRIIGIVAVGVLAIAGAAAQLM